MRVLIVEDEPMLRSGLQDLLRGDGHEVEAVGDGQSAVERGLAVGFDAVVLDLMLPKLDGTEVCRRLRQARPGMGILMLTARGSEDDKVAGLAEGADDYVTKPFGARELLARVRALGRRAGPQAEVIELDGCRLDLARLSGARGGQGFELTPREAGILRMLLQHRDRVVSRAELLERVWGLSAQTQTRTVDMTIANLRKKIEQAPNEPQIIVSVKGAGYRLGGA
jgi:two-component system response regulator RegX3